MFEKKPIFNVIDYPFLFTPSQDAFSTKSKNMSEFVEDLADSKKQMLGQKNIIDINKRLMRHQCSTFSTNIEQLNLANLINFLSSLPNSSLSDISDINYTGTIRVRFVILEKNGLKTIAFGPEGRPDEDKVIGHGELAKKIDPTAECISAGTLCFKITTNQSGIAQRDILGNLQPVLNENGMPIIKLIDNKSGDFRPPFCTLLHLFDAIQKLGIQFDEQVIVEKHTDTGIDLSSKESVFNVSKEDINSVEQKVQEAIASQAVIASQSAHSYRKAPPAAPIRNRKSAPPMLGIHAPISPPRDIAPMEGISPTSPSGTKRPSAHFDNEGSSAHLYNEGSPLKKPRIGHIPQFGIFGSPHKLPRFCLCPSEAKTSESPMKLCL